MKRERVFCDGVFVDGVFVGLLFTAWNAQRYTRCQRREEDEQQTDEETKRRRTTKIGMKERNIRNGRADQA